MFLYVHKDENDIMASGPWNRRGVNYDNQLNDYIIDMNGILRIGIGWKHNCYTEFPYCVLGAGRMIVGRDGIIHYIDNHSGHYRPTEEEFNNSLKYLDHLTIAHKYVWDYSWFCLSSLYKLGTGWSIIGNKLITITTSSNFPLSLI